MCACAFKKVHRAPFLLPVCAGKKKKEEEEEGEFGEREGSCRREEREEHRELKLTFDTQEVQYAAWISFVSL